jgi:DNA-binding NarL/FixJ family response regulator
MNLAVYYGGNPASLQQLEAVIEDIGSKHEVSIYRDLVELRHGLYRPGKHLKLMVLCTADKSDLEGLLLYRELLQDIRIIIILPDLDEATVALAYRLHPRFLASSDTDAAELRAVLNNMVRLYAQAPCGLQRKDQTC